MAQTIALEGIISCSVFHFHADSLIFRFHELRHSHASLLINNGVPILLVSERLGHEDVQTTLRTYGHLYPSTTDAAVDMLDKMML